MSEIFNFTLNVSLKLDLKLNLFEWFDENHLLSSMVKIAYEIADV